MTSFLRRFWHSSLVSGSFLAHPEALVHRFIYPRRLTFFGSVAIDYLNLTWLHSSPPSEAHIHGVFNAWLYRVVA